MEITEYKLDSFSTTPFRVDTQQEQQESYERYYSRVFSVKDAFVTAKRFHDWHRAGLLPFEMPEGKKNLMNLPEFIWVKLVDKLRQVGVSLENIHRVKEELFQVLDVQHMAHRLKQDPKAIRTISHAYGRAGMKEEQREVLLNELESVSPFSGFSGKPLTLLDSLLFFLLNTPDEAGVMLNHGGSVQVWAKSTGVPRWDTTHVYLSITDELNVFRSSRLWQQRTERLSELTEAEWEVIWALRDKSAKEVTVTFMEKGQERQMDITTTRDEQISDEQAEKVIEMLKVGNFESITVKKQGKDSSLFVERKKRRRL